MSLAEGLGNWPLSLVSDHLDPVCHASRGTMLWCHLSSRDPGVPARQELTAVHGFLCPPGSVSFPWESPFRKPASWDPISVSPLETQIQDHCKPGRGGHSTPRFLPRRADSATAAAAKSLQLCPTLCDPIEGSPPSFPIPGILQARTLEWVSISFSNA